MGAHLSLETETTEFWIANIALLAALVVGASAAVVMLFASAMKGRRHDVLRQEPVLQVAGARPADIDVVETRSAIAAAAERSQADAALPSFETSPTPRDARIANKLVLISRLSRFKDTALDVLVYRGGQTDAFSLARMVAEALETAGWSVRIWNTSTAKPARGLLVQTRRGADATVQEPGVKLMLALQEAGLGARAFQPFDPDDTPGSATGDAWTKDMAAPIRLLVGGAP